MVSPYRKVIESANEKIDESRKSSIDVLPIYRFFIQYRADPLGLNPHPQMIWQRDPKSYGWWWEAKIRDLPYWPLPLLKPAYTEANRSLHRLPVIVEE